MEVLDRSNGKNGNGRKNDVVIATEVIEDMDQEYWELDPKEIKTDWRVRNDLGDIDDLADSIDKIGQLQPIAVRLNNKDEPVIIAGMRRTKACIQLGINVKAVVLAPKDEVRALEMQLAENIKRKDFEKLEEAEGLQRYKEMYENLHPETKVGSFGATPDKVKSEDGADRFTKGISDRMGVSEMTIYNKMKPAKLSTEQKQHIKSRKTTKERNKATQEALKKQKFAEKEKKLKDEGIERKKEREVETKTATPKGKGKRRIIKPAENKIVLLTADYETIIKRKDLKKILGKNKVDLLLTDPPYGRKRQLIQHFSRSSINKKVHWDELDVSWLIPMVSLIRGGGSLLIFSPLESIGVYEAMLSEIGLTYKMSVIWHKTNPGTVHRETYLHAVEAIIWAVKGKKYTMQPWENAGTKECHNLIEGPICSGNERLDHPTQKPLWLIKKLMERHSTVEDFVFDPFCGTGTTLVAAKQLKRNGIGIEKSKKFAKMARLRLGSV